MNPPNQTILIFGEALELTARHLQDVGYAVVCCPSAESAAARLVPTGARLDLFIGEVTSAGCSQVETGLRLRQLMPALKLVLMSDYGFHQWSAANCDLVRQLPADAVRILRKPLSDYELLDTIVELLGPVTPSAPAPRRDKPERVERPLEHPVELLERAHDAILAHDAEGRICFWNHGAEILYGWSREQALGRLAHELLQTASPVAFDHMLETLQETGHWEGESRQTTRFGTGVMVFTRLTARTLLGGRTEVLEISHDITSQKHVEEGLRFINQELELRFKELRRVEARFRGLLGAAPDALVIVDAAGKIVLVNQQTETQFGYNRDELSGRNVDMLLPQRFRDSHPAHRSGFARRPHVRPMGCALDLYGLRKNGEEFPVEICLSPMETDEGMLIISSIRDISDRKRFERILREKNLDLAAMSHDMQLALHTIIGSADALREDLQGPLNDRRRKHVGHILEGSRHLLSLLDNALNRGETG